MAKKTTKTMNDKTDDAGKKAALDLALSQISKNFGEGSIMRLGESYKTDIETWPSGRCRWI